MDTKSHAEACEDLTMNEKEGKMLLADRCLYENYKWAYQNGYVIKR